MRGSSLPSLALALSVLLVAGCSSDGSDSASPAPSSPSSPASASASATTSSTATSAPATTSPAPPAEGAIPIGAPRDPASFQGSDQDFLTTASELLGKVEEKQPVTDKSAIAIGREYCSVISSGGQVASKVDFWSGQRGYLGVPAYDALLRAAGRIYCPDLEKSYLAASASPTPPTEVEKVDLMRFIGSLTPGEGGIFAELPDAEIVTRATAVCRREKPKAPLSGADLRRRRTEPDFALLVASLSVYCPELLAQG